MPVFGLNLIFYAVVTALLAYLISKGNADAFQSGSAALFKIKYDAAFAFLLYAVITVIFFLPCIPSINSAMIGDESDGFVYIWNMFWAKKVISSPGHSLYFTNYIFYPDGTTLLYNFYSFYNLALSLLFSGLLKYVTIYNILILQTFVLAGLGAFLLVRYITKDSFLSFVGGYIYAFNPSHYAHALCHINTASIQFIPFFVLFFLKAVRTNSRKDLVLAALFFFLTSLCCWYYLIYTAFFIFFYYCYAAFKEKKVFVFPHHMPPSLPQHFLFSAHCAASFPLPAAAWSSAFPGLAPNKS
ncbi:MAG: hypothetical protein HQL28_04755, partial [Candidatus Omnitrophica bacterium]|nr:hypothetical protein [Candidatus Omnitrophota bacterium]